MNRIPSRPPFKNLLLCLASVVGIAGLNSPANAFKCPNVHIVMDRSGSMSTNMTTSTGGMSTRWDIAKNQLKNLLNIYDGLSPVGLSIFPPTSGMCSSDTPVRPAYFTRAAIGAALDASGPSGSTPSGSAVRNAAMMSELQDPTRRQYVLLLTDGGPGCGGEPDTATGTTGEIRKALMQSPPIYTFVIGIGNLAASEKATLTMMADAGGKAAPTTDKYYPAGNEVELTNSLNTIALMINSENTGCTDVLPDGGGSGDMSMGGDDMSGPPRDMSGPPRDMSGGPWDFSMPPRDMSGGPWDFSMPPRDMSGGPWDFSGPPRDMSGPRPDGGGSSGDPRPKIDWILPKSMPFGMGGPADVTGRNFEPTVPTSEFSLEQGVTSIPLSAALQDSHLAQVIIPANLPVGTYTLVVKNPDGYVDALADAFTVTAPKAGCACSLSPQPPQTGAPLSLLVLALFGGRLLLRSRRRAV